MSETIKLRNGETGAIVNKVRIYPKWTGEWSVTVNVTNEDGTVDQVTVTAVRYDDGWEQV